MSQKRGIIRITPQLLQAVLGLPEDVEIERVFEDPPSRSGLHLNIVVVGEGVPVLPVREGQDLPWLYGEYVLHGNKIGWKFREG